MKRELNSETLATWLQEYDDDPSKDDGPYWADTMAGKLLEAFNVPQVVTITDCLAIAEKLQRAPEVLSLELLEGAPAFTTANGAEEYYLTIRGKEVEVCADLLFKLHLPKPQDTVDLGKLKEKFSLMCAYSNAIGMIFRSNEAYSIEKLKDKVRKLYDVQIEIEDLIDALPQPPKGGV